MQKTDTNGRRSYKFHGKKSICAGHDHPSDGWLRVLVVSNTGENGGEISIPEYLQVEHEGTRVNIPPSRMHVPGAKVTGETSRKVYVCAQTPPDQTYYFPSDPEGREREFCTILEGPHRNKKIVARTLKNDGRFHPLTVTPAVYFVFTLGSRIDSGFIYGTLQYGGSSDIVSAFTDEGNMIPAGEHVLQLPDEPHSGGRSYANMCDSPKTWFRIGDSGDRYLHPGSGSFGCLTIPPEEWNQVFRRLRTARKGDGVNVGTIKIIHPR